MTLSIKNVLILSALVSALPFVSVAHEGATGVVKERMDLMEGMGQQLKQIGLRLQSNRNLPTIAEPAARIGELSRSIPEVFPPGTNQRPSEAKATIWQQWDAFEQRSRAVKEAAQALSAAAPSGDPKLVMDRFRALNRSCNACHDDFREKRR